MARLLRLPSLATMPRLVAPVFLSLALAGASPTAGAQTLPAGTLGSPAVELHQFHGSPFSDRTLRLDGTNVLPPGKLGLGLDADYGLRPLVVKDAADASYALVRHAVGAELRAAVGLTDWLELGALFPLTAYQTGDTVQRVAPPATAGLEAIRAGLKARLLGNGSTGPSLGATALAVIPTGTAGGLVRERGLGAEGNLFGDYRRGALTLAAGGGVRLRRATRLYDIALGNELLVHVAA
jgi:hypothetical protein